MKITVEATVALEDVLAEVSLSDVLDALDMDEVLNEIDLDTMISFISSNHGSKMLKDMDDYDVIRHVSHNITMGALAEDLDEGDRVELLRVLKEGEEPDQPSLSADQWDLIKQDLKVVVKLRDLLGSGPGGDTLSRHEQTIITLIGEHFPS